MTKTLPDLNELAHNLTKRQKECICSLSEEWKSSGYNRVEADLIYATDNQVFPGRHPPLVDCRYFRPYQQSTHYQHKLTPLGAELKTLLEQMDAKQDA